MAAKVKTTTKLPVIGKEQVELLEKLSNASAPPGDEGAVRAIVLEEARKATEDVRQDALGNVIALRAGSGESRMKVMLAAHMDEVGLVITNDDGDGLFQFVLSGGIDLRVLPGKPVLVGRERVPGVIGARAVHLTTMEQRAVAIPLETMRIDVGPGDAKGKVKVGDRAVFATRFQEFRGSLRGKALDNRLGVATLLELLRHPLPGIDLYCVFTTQEEIGGRGAAVAAYSIHPDMAVAVDSTPAHDLPMFEEEEDNAVYNTRLGAGPAVYVMDSGTISDPRLVSLFIQTAEKNGIPCQFRQPGRGGTDAGAIHRQHGGIPSISVSVPGRHAHTPIGLAYRSDWEHTLQLLYLVMKDVRKDLLAR